MVGVITSAHGPDPVVPGCLNVDPVVNGRGDRDAVVPGRIHFDAVVAGNDYLEPVLGRGLDMETVVPAKAASVAAAGCILDRHYSPPGHIPGHHSPRP
jgi:hypothetical protein